MAEKIALGSDAIGACASRRTAVVRRGFGPETLH
jgi:hypothetical protein